MKCAIIQPSYIPWKGFFHIIQSVDQFIFLDDVQVTLRDWRTRNYIKTPTGLLRLTIPIAGGRNQTIQNVRMFGDRWRHDHFEAIRFNYKRAPHFDEFRGLLDWMYGSPHESLSDFHMETTKRIARTLGIQSTFLKSSDLGTTGTKTAKIISLCRAIGADEYLAGPRAKRYIEPAEFDKAGIALQFISYPSYPAYPQRHAPFEHHVSILDLLFNCGSGSANFIWGSGCVL